MFEEATNLKRWLMEILACPAKDCRSELQLEAYVSRSIKTEKGDVEEIDEALITCPKCGRWYPVIDGIACMLPDDLRMADKQRAEEVAFLARWKDRIRPDILNNGRPFGLEHKD